MRKILVAATGLAFGLAGVSGAGHAAADPAPPGSEMVDRPPLRLTYTCEYPLLGTKKLTVEIRSNIPKVLLVGTETPPTIVETVSTVGPDTTEGLWASYVATLEGYATAQAVIEFPDGPIDATIDSVLEKTQVPAEGSFTVKALADLGFGWGTIATGPSRAVVRGIDLVVVLKKADGSYTNLGPRLEVPCKQDPGQNSVLAEFEVLAEPDQAKPSTPGAPTVTGKTDTTASLSWAASTDNTRVTNYDIYNGATKVGGSYGTTSATVTGLRPDTDYTLSVKARDGSDNVSDAGGAVRVRTDKDVTPPTQPGTPDPTGKNETSVSLSWRGSTDKNGVVGYDVFANGRRALRATGTSAKVPGLSPDTDYTFTVKALDAYGNLSPPSRPRVVRTWRDDKAPTTPGRPWVTRKTANSVTLKYPAAKDNIGVVGYNVYRNGKLVLRVPGTTPRLTGLRPNTSYAFKVRARDQAGNLSRFSLPLTVRTNRTANAATFAMVLPPLLGGGEPDAGLDDGTWWLP